MKQCLDCRKVRADSEIFCPYCGEPIYRSTKRCRGVSHPPGGEQVSLDEFTIMKSGKWKGRPISKCKSCRSNERKTAAPVNVYWPLIEKLKQNGYRQKDIARAIGVDDDQVSKWALKKRKWMNRKNFVNILKLAQEVNRKDRQHVIQSQLDD